MDEFKNIIDANKFRSTNALWNQLALNDPWSVGYVSNLIESKNFNYKEEWEEFYYSSGKERGELIKKLPSDQRSILNNFLLVKQNRNQVLDLF